MVVLEVLTNRMPQAMSPPMDAFIPLALSILIEDFKCRSKGPRCKSDRWNGNGCYIYCETRRKSMPRIIVGM